MEALNNKYNTEFTNRLLANKHILDEIEVACNHRLTNGSYLVINSYTYADSMYEKQELLYNSTKKVTKALEIGVYIGHSLFIMLLSNPELKITCIDIDDSFAVPAISVLNKHFNNAITFIHGNSLDVLPTITDKFDFFHIDGAHYQDVITQEFHIVYKNLNSDPDKFTVIFDDQDCIPDLQEYISNNLNVIECIKPDCI